MITNSSCGTIETKRTIPVVIRPVDSAPTCDQVLDACNTVVEKQKVAITAQQEVIQKQDELIQTETEQVGEEKEQKTIWEVLAIVEGALLALLMLK